jgi:beta-glucosidase
MYDIFSLPDCHFPPGFLWGSATAGHQIEGNNIHSQHWTREQRGETPEASGLACNSYVQWHDDHNLLSELGHRAYRMSIEWSRIEPAQGEFNTEALDHYKEVIDDLKERGLKVFLTLWHFTHPQWFEDLGGFGKRENLKYFERYARHVAKALADRVDSWNVLNEFNLRPNDVENYILAHARGYRIIKEFSKAPVSSAHAFVRFEPWRQNDCFDRAMTDYLDLLHNEFFFHGIRTGEFIRPQRDMEFFPELKGACDYRGFHLQSGAAEGSARSHDRKRAQHR